MSIGMEPDGDFTTLYTQQEIYSDGSVANDNIYYRSFDETTDTAGPRVVGLSDESSSRIVQNAVIHHPVQYLVLTFDEDMLAGDPTLTPDSVLNPLNYQLWHNGSSIDGGIAAVHYGLNEASQLAGLIDPLTGQPYDLSNIPSNKWEVVLTLDGNGTAPVLRH